MAPKRRNKPLSFNEFTSNTKNLEELSKTTKSTILPTSSHDIKNDSNTNSQFCLKTLESGNMEILIMKSESTNFQAKSIDRMKQSFLEDGLNGGRYGGSNQNSENVETDIDWRERCQPVSGKTQQDEDKDFKDIFKLRAAAAAARSTETPLSPKIESVRATVDEFNAIRSQTTSSVAPSSPSSWRSQSQQITKEPDVAFVRSSPSEFAASQSTSPDMPQQWRDPRSKSNDTRPAHLQLKKLIKTKEASKEPDATPENSNSKIQVQPATQEGQSECVPELETNTSLSYDIVENISSNMQLSTTASVSEYETIISSPSLIKKVETSLPPLVKLSDKPYKSEENMHKSTDTTSLTKITTCAEVKLENVDENNAATAVTSQSRNETLKSASQDSMKLAKGIQLQDKKSSLVSQKADIIKPESQSSVEYTEKVKRALEALKDRKKTMMEHDRAITEKVQPIQPTKLSSLRKPSSISNIGKGQESEQIVKELEEEQLKQKAKAINEVRLLRQAKCEAQNTLNKKYYFYDMDKMKLFTNKIEECLRDDEGLNSDSPIAIEVFDFLDAFDKASLIPSILLLVYILRYTSAHPHVSNLHWSVIMFKPLLLHLMNFEVSQIPQHHLLILYESVKICFALKHPTLDRNCSLIEALWDVLYIEKVIENHYFDMWLCDDKDTCIERNDALFKVIDWFTWKNTVPVNSSESTEKILPPLNEDEDIDDIEALVPKRIDLKTRNFHRGSVFTS